MFTNLFNEMNEVPLICCKFVIISNVSIGLSFCLNQRMPLIYVSVFTISALLLVFPNGLMFFAGSIYESTEEYISIYTKFKTSALDKKS